MVRLNLIIIFPFSPVSLFVYTLLWYTLFMIPISLVMPQPMISYCLTCNNLFTHIWHLMTHVGSSHSSDYPINYQCIPCSAEFLSMKFLLDHIDNIHRFPTMECF